MKKVILKIKKIIKKNIKKNILIVAYEYRKDRDPTPYRSADAAIIFYDVTNKKSFENAEEWKYTIALYSRRPVSNLFVATKNDLNHQNKIEKTEMIKLIDKFKVPIIKTSSRMNENINCTINFIIFQLIQKYEYNIPPCPSPLKKWPDNELFYDIPLSFRSIIYYFLLCLKSLGFVKQRKIPKYVLFKIFSGFCIIEDIASFINQFVHNFKGRVMREIDLLILGFQRDKKKCIIN